MDGVGLDALTTEQHRIINQPLQGCLLVKGPAGTGKTTAGIFRGARLIEEGHPPASVLVIVPQRRLGEPYLHHPELRSGAFERPEVLTIAGLARRMVELFWPLIAEKAGFKYPQQPPRFLTLETAQYQMARVVGPYLDEGYFDSLSLDRYRLYQQILDNLNKSAVVGFPPHEIGVRLSEAWVGPEDQTRAYAQAQHCAEQFRASCYAGNLVDFSLTYELFFQLIEERDSFRQYFDQRYQHLIADNIEEETPRGHDLLARWSQRLNSSTLIADNNGGFSRFLGADPSNLAHLRQLCDQEESLDLSFVSSKAVRAFSTALSNSINLIPTGQADAWREAIQVHSTEYLPDLVKWISNEISELVRSGILASEIAVVSPFISDSLRFLLTYQLEQAGLSWVTHRPSRAIVDEAENRCLLTLAAIAHPAWGIAPSRDRVAQALIVAIEGLDPVRATLLANTLYRISGRSPKLGSFQQLRPEMQIRIGEDLGLRYERLREWIEDAPLDPTSPLDQFLGRLFGELLSQPGYGFHSRMDAGRAASAMIRSVQKFKSVFHPGSSPEDNPGRAYYGLVNEGLLAAQYRSTLAEASEEAVFIAPVVTYLAMNRRSQIQFWLDIGNPAWAERLYQPLTHPYVLSRSWERGSKWSDEDEQAVRRQILMTMTVGLTRRCGKRVYLCQNTYGDQGLEQQGVLLNALQSLLSEDFRNQGR